MFATALLFSQEPAPETYYNAIVDPYLSPYVGGDDLLFLHWSLRCAENAFVNRETLSSKTFLGGLLRVGELELVWLPINYTMMVTQHEVFGHGFRVRSLWQYARVEHYKWGVPPPYGPGGGATGYLFVPSHITTFQDLAIASGGVEATAILANRTRLEWLQSGGIDYRESSLYNWSQQDLTNYVFATMPDDGGDISHYIRVLNETYPSDHLTHKQMKQQALVNLFDPFTYYSLYAQLNYIFTGNSKGYIPMIPIGSYRYLPSPRYGLTPFGPEFYLENFLVKDNRPIYFYLRAGHFAGSTYTGAGIEYAYLWEKNGNSLGFRADIWHQPFANFNNRSYAIEKLLDGEPLPSPPHKPQFGGALSLIARKRMTEHSSFFFQLGAKTPGFLPGEPLETFPIARLGVSLRY
jgi:hypothetical protein